MIKMVSDEVRSNINYIVYAYNTVDRSEILFNIPSGTEEEVDEVLREDFGVESRKIEFNIHPDYQHKACSN